ncbi:hypothetical protein LguiA_012358 [Lonicera macranthoides]
MRWWRNWFGKKRAKPSDLPYLPEDLLIDEILPRMPVKSLLQFKCVCKKWYNLIESPNFIRTHFNHPKNQTRLLVCHYIHGSIVPKPDYDSDSDSDSDDDEYPLALAIFPHETLETLSPNETLASPSSPPVHHDIIDFVQHCPDLHQIHMIGPVDGLFLLHAGFDGRNDRLALWNPATAEFRRLPRPIFRFPTYRPRSNVFGFGWDPLREDYKVVWIPAFFPGAPFNHAATAMYTLGTESWRQIDNPSVLDSVREIWWRCSTYFHVCIEYFSGVYLNGAFYWLVECSCGLQIVLFDMSREVFRKIPAPYNGLAPYQHNLLHPLGFWRNDKELFGETAANKLVLCDLNTHRIKYLGVRGHTESKFLQVIKYKESLVSVKAGQMEKWNRDKLRDIIRDFFDLPYDIIRDSFNVPYLDPTEEEE